MRQDVPPYAVVAERIAAAVRACGGDAIADREVPACPLWTVRQTLAHLAGGAADISVGNLARAGRDDWTAEQVQARADRSVTDLLDEWAVTAPRIAGFLVGPAGGQAVFDALTHEFDLRSALGLARAEPDEVLPVAVAWLAPNFGRAVERRGVPALRVVADSGTWEFGSGEPAATLRGNDYDVLRSISGRRTREQVQTLLDGDVDTWWPAFRWGPFTPPATPVDAA